MRIAGILLTSGFPSDFEMGILNSADRFKRLADALMGD